MAKVDAVLRPFRNREDNLDEFWQQFLVVCKLQKLSDEKARMGTLPLYLSGEAFTVWSSMEEADHEDDSKVKGRLAESFSMLPGEAYSFVKRRKRVDESVDAYLADLRRLLGISGHKEDGGGKDPMLMEQFLAGLPKNLADQLRLSNAATASGLSIAAISSQARALCAVTAASAGTDQKAAVTGAVSQQSSAMCYECNQTGHTKRDCPTLFCKVYFGSVKSKTRGFKPLKIYKTSERQFLSSNIRQLGSLTKKVALPSIVCGLRPT